MSDIQNNGGPAFPVSLEHTDVNASGMSLLDYFAGHALQGIVASGNFAVIYDNRELIPSTAYRLANSMLRERKKHVRDA